jgi:hypothetical protein
MSKAAVTALKQRRDLERKHAANERFFALAEYTSAIDSAVVACDDCGLLNVTHQGVPCFMCGGEVGTSA